MAEFDRLILTCEHGGNRVPPKFRALFEGRRELLESHAGWDAGALETARLMADRFDAPLHANTLTRLIIDFNRTIGNPDMWKEETSAAFTREQKDKLIEKHYRPWRGKVESQVADWVGAGETVLHLSIHSFGSVVNGERRNADVGLLYDPARKPEMKFCVEWQDRLEHDAPHIPVRRNYPYAGTDDGFTRALRLLFPAKQYAGIELEMNSRDFHENREAWRDTRDATIDALEAVLKVRKK